MVRPPSRSLRGGPVRRTRTHEVAAERHRRKDAGASLVEYALLVALIALVCVTAVVLFGGSTAGNLNESGSEIRSATD